MTSCANPGMQSYSGNTHALLEASKAPREGWATDPHLSYRLFSYYPTNYYNTGFYTGPYGYGGIYYH